MKILATLLIVLTLAACGGHGHEHNQPANNAGGDGHHGHSHDGPRHLIGDKKYDEGYYVGLAHLGRIVAGNEVMFEVLVKKDDKDVSDAIAIIWIVDKDGAELTRRVTGTWMPAESLYDTHIMMPKNLPDDAQVSVQVRHGGKTFDATYGLTGHDHD